jgi:hypothetical protein
MTSRQFLGHIRRFHVAGEDETPEIVVMVSIPLQEVTDLAFLGAVKKHGLAVIDIQSAQSEMAMEDAEA